MIKIFDLSHFFLKICPDTVKAEILRIIQAWAHGFRNEPKYKVIEDTRNLLKMEGKWAGTRL